MKKSKLKEQIDKLQNKICNLEIEKREILDSQFNQDLSTVMDLLKKYGEVNCEIEYKYDSFSLESKSFCIGSIHKITLYK